MSGDRFIVEPNSTFELKGDTANKAFKFIQKTQKISDYRGDRIGDGILRIEYQFEEPLPKLEQKTVITTTHHHDHYHPHWYRPYWGGCLGGGRLIGSSFSASNSSSGPATFTSSVANLGGGVGSVMDAGEAEFEQDGYATSVNFTNTSSNDLRSISRSKKGPRSAPVAEAAVPLSGITVKGGDVDQSFVTGYTRTLQAVKYAMVLELYGETEAGKQVILQQHSRKKVKCETCGTVNAPNFRYCSECGTSLT